VVRALPELPPPARRPRPARACTGGNTALRQQSPAQLHSSKSRPHGHTARLEPTSLGPRTPRTRSRAWTWPTVAPCLPDTPAWWAEVRTRPSLPRHHLDLDSTIGASYGARDPLGDVGAMGRARWGRVSGRRRLVSIVRSWLSVTTLKNCWLRMKPWGAPLVLF
jgi:hypothetical protein